MDKADSDERLRIIQEEIEQRWAPEWTCETDKAWDGIHRSLTDGQPFFESGEYPLKICIPGGKALHSGTNFIVSLVTPERAGDVGRALATVTAEYFREDTSESIR